MALAFVVGVDLVLLTVAGAIWFPDVPIRDRASLVVMMLQRPGDAMTGPLAVSSTEAVSGAAPFDGVAGQVYASGSVGAYFRSTLVVGADDRAHALAGVTPGYFRLLGLQIRGRDFQASDDRPGAEPVAVISDRLWAEAFGRDPEIIGQVVSAKPLPVRIVGVAPPRFTGAMLGQQTEVWVPATLMARLAPGANEPGANLGPPLMLFARLRPGVTPAEAERALRNEASGPLRPLLQNARLVPLPGLFSGVDSNTVVLREAGPLTIAELLAGLVLLGGCATLAALGFVEYGRRRPEFAVRIALGCSRGRLVRMLAGELGWVAAAGTTAALAVAALGLRLVPAVRLPGGADLQAIDLSMRWPIVAAAVVLASLMLAVSASLPIAGIVRHSGAVPGDRTATASGDALRLRRVFLCLHVGSTVVVLICAGLFLRAVSYALSTSVGFDADHTLFATVQLPVALPRPGDDQRQSLATVRATHRLLLDGLCALPSVTACATGPAPISAAMAPQIASPRTISADGRQSDARVAFLMGDPGYLAALGIPIEEGRGLLPADGVGPPYPAVIAASLARRLWPAQSAVGQEFALLRVRYVVVGVARQFQVGAFDARSADALITATRGDAGFQPTFILHSPRASALIDPARRLIRQIVPDANMVTAITGRELVLEELGRQRLGAFLFSAFGMVSLILATGSVWSLVASAVRLRRREFGIRTALGATRPQLVWAALSEGLAPTVIGAVCGLLVGAGVGRVVAASLAGLSSVDALAYGAVALLVVGGPAIAALAATRAVSGVALAAALRSDE